MKIKNLRWWIISLVCLVTIVNYLARSSLSVAAPTLFTELHITEQQYSWIISAFQLAYTVAQPICGYILDVVGLKMGFFIFAVAWSLVNMAHAFVGTWQGLAFLRGLMGLTEASVIPAGMKTSAEWFPASERGIAGGLFNVGTSIGAMLAPPLVVWAILTFNWEAAFVITGGIGLVVAIIWYLVYNSPEKHPALTDEEKKYIFDGQEKHLQSTENEKPAMGVILKQRNFWGIAVTRFLADPAWGTISFWMPLYLTQVMHMPIKEIAMFPWLPFLAADFGCVAGGFLTAFLIKRCNITTVNSRRIGFTIAAVLMTAIGFVSIVESAYVAIALISLGGFAHQMLSTLVITLASDLFKKSEVATVTGLAGSAAWAGQLSFNLLMGALVVTIGYGSFFIILGFLDLIGAVVLWTVIKDTHPSETNKSPKLATQS